MIKPHSNAVGFYDNMRKIIPAVRAAGIQIFIVPHHRSHKDDFENWIHVNPVQLDTSSL